jgi:glucoamylase
VVWQGASGTPPGNGQLVVDQPSGTATLVVPRSAFGAVRSGWIFTVTLTGQDGFSADQARAFTATPEGFSFGVCASGASSPICAVDPSTVPKVMDTLTPAGVSQAAELDPTHGPVSLHGVAVP